MLYFSKIKIFFIYIVIIVLTSFAILNFFNSNDNYFLKKNINLGLDLQGGSYLLLEVDAKPLIKQKLQNKLITLRQIFKKQKINYGNLNIKNNRIIFMSNENIIVASGSLAFWIYLGRFYLGRFYQSGFYPGSTG